MKKFGKINVLVVLGMFVGIGLLATMPVDAAITETKLTASDGAMWDVFGSSVSISGDTALIGAWGDDALGDDSGSAYVFVRDGTTWTEQAKLTASDGAMWDVFGSSVSISGDTALIGAYHDDDLGTDSGSAYVFVRSGIIWTQQAKLTASDREAWDLFGFSVSISGDTALIGAEGDDASGSAYVYELFAAVEAVVGGTAMPANKIELMAPWIAVAVLITLSIIMVILRGKKKQTGV